jgi:drug/metabolite transporter (DMT)-like permease
MGIATDTITSTIITTSTATDIASATASTAESIASHPLINRDPPTTTVIGDVQTLIAALFYSLATVRIPRYASKMSPLTLAFGKSAFLATTAVGTALLETMNHSSTANTNNSSNIEHIVTSLTRLWPDWASSSSSGGDSTIVWVLLIWSAFGPGSLAAFLMVKGQSMVSATDAQIAFATVPLWSAVLALGMVSQESVGWLTWVGGAMMIGAGVYAALEGRKAAAAARIE